MYKFPYLKRLLKFQISAVILCVLFSSWLFATDMAGRYVVSGIGKDSCISYVDADDEGRAYYRTWLSGYITAHNFNVENTYSIVNKKSLTEIEGWLRGYCFANTSHTFEQAVKGLVRSLEYNKKKNYYDN